MAITKANSRVEPVVQGMVEAILAGKYATGQQLPTETELQRAWGVSRSVVREAMKVLASQGLVRIEQGRGSFVNESLDGPLRTQLQLMLRRGAIAEGDPAAQEAGEWSHLMEVRRVLEVEVARWAALRASPANIAAMEAAIVAMRERPDEPAGYVDADLAFHRALAAATGNPLWPALLNGLNDLLRRYREAGFRGAPGALQAARQHQAILDAVRARDADACVEAMKKHLKMSERDLEKRGGRRPAKTTTRANAAKAVKSYPKTGRNEYGG